MKIFNQSYIQIGAFIMLVATTALGVAALFAFPGYKPSYSWLVTAVPIAAVCTVVCCMFLVVQAWGDFFWGRVKDRTEFLKAMQAPFIFSSSHAGYAVVFAIAALAIFSMMPHVRESYWCYVVGAAAVCIPVASCLGCVAAAFVANQIALWRMVEKVNAGSSLTIHVTKDCRLLVYTETETVIPGELTGVEPVDKILSSQRRHTETDCPIKVTPGIFREKVLPYLRQNLSSAALQGLEKVIIS